MSIEEIKLAIAKERARIADKYREEISNVSLWVSADEVKVWAYGTRGTDRYHYCVGVAHTADAAAEKLIEENFTRPEMKAAKLRKQATELLARAAALENGGES